MRAVGCICATIVARCGTSVIRRITVEASCQLDSRAVKGRRVVENGTENQMFATWREGYMFGYMLKAALVGAGA